MILKLIKIIFLADNPFLRSLTKNFINYVFEYISGKDLLNLEQTCKYAYWKCRSSKLIDEIVWKKEIKLKSKGIFNGSIYMLPP